MPAFRVTVVEGPGAGETRDSADGRLAIGSHELNDLIIDEPTVSRFHCEIVAGADGVTIVDLKSRNGVIVGDVQVREAVLRGPSAIRIGRSLLRFEPVTDRRVEIAELARFGALVATSAKMKASLALLERAAGSDATVLIEAETGTGKGKAAEAIHAASARAKGPLIVVDCGALAASVLDSELFGHEKGAFTGATARRIGAFEEAAGGTVFLDEIGELPLDLQPKLLRALENREVRRVGANRFTSIDVRLVAATHRNLRHEVNAGRFRSDLYYRLAVVKIPIPPLRERPEDIPGIVLEILEQLGAPDESRRRILSEENLAALARWNWPGNVRELRNHLERAVVLDEEAVIPGPGGGGGTAAARRPVGEAVAYAEAKKRALAAFERSYLEDLLARFDGKVAAAAGAAGVDRVYLYRLLRRHGMKPNG
jgi:DNA-binding NtrC family response regulator